MKNITVVSASFVLLLLLLWNPFHFWMPTTLDSLIVAALAVVAAVFAGLVIGEKAYDEREEVLRARAARAGYLAGIFVLVLGIALSILHGARVNDWMLCTLAVMVLVRAFVRAKTE